MATTGHSRRGRISIGETLLPFLPLLALTACDGSTGPENRPPASLGAIPDQIVAVDSAVAVDLSAHFNDPDGDPLTYAALSADPSTAAVAVASTTLTITGVAAGATTVTATARDPEGLAASRSFAVTVPNRAPVVAETIADGEVHVADEIEIDAAAHFADPDGDPLEYAAVSSDTTRAAVAVSGGVVTVTGVGVGSATITVTARDPEGLEAEQSFGVTIPNRPPEAVGTIEDREVEVDSAAVLDVAPYFTEPDGESLEYAATSSDPARVVMALAESTLTVTGVAKGGVTVTVTARDPHGAEAGQVFAVTVPNRAPVVAETIADRQVHVADEIEIDAAAHFADPDGDPLEYAAVSSDTTRAAVAVSGGVVTVAGAGVGGSTVTVTARDPEGLEAAQSFGVTVPNRAPVAVGTIEDREVQVDSFAVLDVAPYFTEPDGEALEYAATSSDPARVVVALAESTLTVTGVARGGVTVMVTVRDPHGAEAGQVFAVTVPNRAPQPVSAIADRQVHVGDEIEIDAAAHFTDPDGDPLEYAAASSDTTRAAVAVSGAVLTVTGAGVGTAAITVTATDPGGLAAAGSFGVTVVPVPAPDLVVDPPSASPPLLGPGEAFTLGAVVRNRGDALASSGTTLRYYRSADAAIGTGDTELGTSAVPPLAPSRTSTRSLRVTAPGAIGIYYYGACADPVDNESDTENNCSGAVAVEVAQDNRAPVVTSPLPDLSAIEGWRYRTYLPAVFTDPDGDDLAWSTISTNSAVAEAELSNDSVVVNAIAAGSATLTVTATDPEGLQATDEFEVEVVAASFDLDLLFTDGFSDAHLSAIVGARHSWESILAGTELGNVTLPETVSCLGLTTTSVGTVDDHLALVGIASIDGSGGTLALAGFCYARVSDGTPAVSATVFDEMDIDRMLSAGSLADVAFHEFAHALGFVEPHWERHNLLAIGADPHFAGTGAVEAFNSAGGTAYAGAKVPISSPDHSHWRESVFGREGMTPRISLGVRNPFSAVTLEAMADIGYVVNSSLADDYELPGGTPPDAAAERAGLVFDLSGDVVLEPIVVIDADGRVVRVIPPPPGAVLPSFRRQEVRVDRPENDRAGVWTRSPARRGPPPG